MADAATRYGQTPIEASAAKLDRLLFAGGGTGGHVFMAVAVRDFVTARGGHAPKVLFVGTREGLESDILPRLEFPLETIRIGGLQRMGFGRQLASLIRLPFSLLQSAGILRRFMPRLVVGLGGYSSGPVVAAARLLRFRCMLIEPNAVPGLTNRWLARFCQGAAVAFTETARWFTGNVQVTGIPVREEFHKTPDLDVAGSGLKLLVAGGSRGSRPINRLMCEALPLLGSLPLSIVHQTGPDDHSWVRRAYAAHQVEAEVKDFIYDMPRRFRDADLILSRAGASSIAEITASGRPAILIPFPQAADDHQRMNAEVLQRAGAALLMEQTTTGPGDLARTLSSLAADRPRLVAMGRAARGLARPDSTARIVRLMESLVGGCR